MLLLLLFLTFSVLVANPKKLLYTVANPARGLLNREKRTKEKVWQHTPPPHPPHCSFGENKYVCACVCCVVIPFILDVRLVDIPAGVTQEEGNTGLLHLPSAVLALICIARRNQPSLSLVDREVEFSEPTKQSFSTCWA